MVDTLADRILANERVQYSRVRIGGVPRDKRVTNTTYQESFDQPCPIVTLMTSRPQDFAVTRGAPVTVDLGYDGVGRRVFSGSVQPRNRPSIAVGQLQCAGEMWKLVRDVEIAERDVGGLTVKQAITTLFDDLNIASYDLSGVPAYTLANPQTLDKGTGLSMLTKLMEIDGLRVRETGSGQLFVARYEGLPSATLFRQYSTTVTPTMRILDGGLTEDPTWYRTQVTVLGATLADGTPIK